jgi:hypothetical protein
MKDYPSIPKQIPFSEPVVVFDKLDGSLIRAEWNPKRGFYKYGRRNGLLDDSNPHLTVAPSLVRAKYADDLDAIFRKERLKGATAFFELYGPESFAGNHNGNLTVTLIDLAVEGKGFVPTKDFLKWTANLEIPTVLHEGKINQEFVEAVASGNLEGVTFEGVVCKGRQISPGQNLMYKIKSRAWLDKLKTFCNGNEVLFNQLS